MPTLHSDCLHYLIMSTCSYSFQHLLCSAADGVDLKWLEDTHFESLTDLDIKKSVTGGIAADTMTERLITAGFNPDDIDTSGDLASVIEAIEHAPTTQIHMLATYTAMLEIRKAFIEKG